MDCGVVNYDHDLPVLIELESSDFTQRLENKLLKETVTHSAFDNLNGHNLFVRHTGEHAEGLRELLDLCFAVVLNDHCRFVL